MDDTELDSDEEERSLDLKSNFELQLAELEMLQSMYGNPGELQVDGDEAVEMVRMYVDDEISYHLLEARIGYTIKLTADQMAISLACRYPHHYPSIPPDVHLRTALCRASHKQFCDDLHTFIRQQPAGELIMLSLIEWLKTQSQQYKKQQTTSATANKHLNKTKIVHARFWIYSHHIYSKFKRKDILDWAKDLGLTGFSMPGKPGVICAEGAEEDVEEYWARLRRMNWKKLILKHMERSDGKNFLKFTNFEEKNFDVRGGKGREYHMDLGKFCKFLEEMGCQGIFELYFGVEGKITDEK